MGCEASLLYCLSPSTEAIAVVSLLSLLLLLGLHTLVLRQFVRADRILSSKYSHLVDGESRKTSSTLMPLLVYSAFVRYQVRVGNC
jgi:hypothetical protein